MLKYIKFLFVSLCVLPIPVGVKISFDCLRFQYLAREECIIPYSILKVFHCFTINEHSKNSSYVKFSSKLNYFKTSISYKIMVLFSVKIVLWNVIMVSKYSRFFLNKATSKRKLEPPFFLKCANKELNILWVSRMPKQTRIIVKFGSLK